VSIVGAGRLGTALGLALRRAGHKIEVVATAHAATARDSANAIGSKTIPSTAVQLQDTRIRSARSASRKRVSYYRNA
jgi:2-polyprenyl-6-methoxyphenol hydroxylase-like FAD-dependent oxidoreductase